MARSATTTRTVTPYADAPGSGPAGRHRVHSASGAGVDAGSPGRWPAAGPGSSGVCSGGRCTVVTGAGTVTAGAGRVCQ